jgi:hypothetical protein
MYLTMDDRKFPRLAVCLLIGSWFLPVPSAAQRRGMTGSVTARDGTPIEGVLVVTSGMGFNGWTTSKADGSFELFTIGEFVSFRHADYKPTLVRSSDLTNPVRLQLVPSDETVWKLESCTSLPGKGRGWIGGGLRVNAGGNHTGPVYGEHDSHWYVQRGSDRLHVVHGYAWHAGLPLEQTLARSESILVRGWVFDKIVGLDLSGHTSDGKYWRWVGAPVADAIEYETSSRNAADYFDKIVASMCFQAVAQTKH